MDKKTATVKNIQNLTSDTIQIDFEADNSFSFKTGQFISIDVPGQDKPTMRAYSIASSQSSLPLIQFCVKIVKDGIGSNYLVNLSKNDEIVFNGPYGHFVLSDDLNKDKLFIATGTGLAPIRAMIKDLKDKSFKNKYHLIFGVRYEEDLFYIDEIKTLSDTIDNFTYTLAVSRIKEDKKGLYKGRITKVLEGIEFKNQEMQEVYICGNKDMIQEVKEILIDKELDKKNIFAEQFY